MDQAACARPLCPSMPKVVPQPCWSTQWLLLKTAAPRAPDELHRAAISPAQSPSACFQAAAAPVRFLPDARDRSTFADPTGAADPIEAVSLPARLRRL